MSANPANASLQQDEQQLNLVRTATAAVEAGKARIAHLEGELQKYAAERAAVDKLIPRVIDALVEHERIEPHEREKAATVLRIPENMAAILIKTADPRLSLRRAPMGAPEPTTKQAAASGGADYDKPRLQPKMSKADEAYRRVMEGGSL